jgi:MoxR-like ATPase
MFYMRDKLHEQGTSLVMTKYLLQHTTRVARAIQWPLQGHALLVGHPGCGRTTVAKIGAVVAGHNIFQVSCFLFFYIFSCIGFFKI